MPETTRFAPSPTGRLHLGHVHSAFFSARAAGSGGRFILRIEDIDASRCRPAHEAGIFEDLAWLGLDWPQPVRRQSDHLEDYREALARLDEAGLLYPCFCTRKEIADEIARATSAPHGPDGPLYPGLCRGLDEAEATERRAAGLPFALRLRMDEACRRAGRLLWQDVDAGSQTARPERFGDVVLARKDTPTSYHLAVTVDDALQEVTLVTRGADLFEASNVHRLLQALLELPVPRWRHHRLLTDADGRRYAKRDRSVTVESLRAAGHTPAEIRALADVGSD